MSFRLADQIPWGLGENRFLLVPIFLIMPLALTQGYIRHFTVYRGYIEAIREIEHQTHQGTIKTSFDDIISACGRFYSSTLFK